MHHYQYNSNLYVYEILVVVSDLPYLFSECKEDKAMYDRDDDLYEDDYVWDAIHTRIH